MEASAFILVFSSLVARGCYRVFGVSSARSHQDRVLEHVFRDERLRELYFFQPGEEKARKVPNAIRS